MKKFIIICAILIVIISIFNAMYYRLGIFIDLQPNKEVTTFIKTSQKDILIKKNDEYEKFEIKGVDLGSGIPGKFATDYAIDKETYIKWFGQIQEMGANTIRVYTILGDDFYNAFYEYNKNNSNPLYLIHGLWVNDYIQFSSVDAYDDNFRGRLLDDSKTLIDVIHGKRTIIENDNYGNGKYRKDISQWVIGYILGVEWEDTTVAYTNHMQEDKNSYQGKYMYTTEDATPFEAMLAEVGDKIIEYESKRYKQQRLVAFSNWPTTDPFTYDEVIKKYFSKIESVNVEHIKITDEVISGTFASYHIYPYYPDYLKYEENYEEYVDENGDINTYREYLKRINEYHTIPVVISEFGVPSSRGMTQRDEYTNRNQGGMSETEQGEAIIKSYNDIKAAGCSGAIIFTWQDEWFKRTWNTMYAVNLNKLPYWSDYQTNEQYFGLLSFDPGEEESVCYVDGDITEWNDEDIVSINENASISMKYDEKFIYFLVKKDDYREDEKIYIPIDTTQKSGSTYCENNGLKFKRNADFLICIDGKDNSRVLVQKRYEILRAINLKNTDNEDPYLDIPDKNTSEFQEIKLMLRLRSSVDMQIDDDNMLAETYETGKLTYGNANPEAEDFNSLADFCINGDYIEIKLPWQLLNFSNPSEMMIHDDYYENYGVEEMQIDEMYVGVASEENTETRIPMEAKELIGWGTKVTYHERLKKSYYMIKEVWAEK